MCNAKIRKIIKIVNALLQERANTEEGYEFILVNEEMLDFDLVLLGMDSLTFIKIIVAIEEEFKCEFADEVLLISQLNTINKLYQAMI